MYRTSAFDPDKTAPDGEGFYGIRNASGDTFWVVPTAMDSGAAIKIIVNGESRTVTSGEASDSIVQRNGGGDWSSPPTGGRPATVKLMEYRWVAVDVQVVSESDAVTNTYKFVISNSNTN